LEAKTGCMLPSHDWGKSKHHVTKKYKKIKSVGLKKDNSKVKKKLKKKKKSKKRKKK